jgi:hypothetical protein
MIRSVLNVSPFELAKIRENMPETNKRQKKVKENFFLTLEDRVKLTELQSLLEIFEFVTNELQSNRICISRVYPCIRYLQKELTKNVECDVYTRQLRLDYHSSLMKRFGSLIEQDIFLVLTFLDPNFGLNAF